MTCRGPRPVERHPFAHLRQPWKISSFLLATAFFVWGADHWDAPTWDVGVSVLMSAVCFAFAPWSVSRLVSAVVDPAPRRLWRTISAAAVTYFIASGSYEIYNTLRFGFHPPTYWENLFFSVPVTIVAGLIWNVEGSLAAITSVLLDRVRVVVPTARTLKAQCARRVGGRHVN